MWALVEAVNMQPDSENLVCTNCGRAPRPGENADDDWRAASDGTGELLVFCPEWWQRGAPSRRKREPERVRAVSLFRGVRKASDGPTPQAVADSY